MLEVDDTKDTVSELTFFLCSSLDSCARGRYLIEEDIFILKIHLVTSTSTFLIIFKQIKALQNDYSNKEKCPLL